MKDTIQKYTPLFALLLLVACSGVPVTNKVEPLKDELDLYGERTGKLGDGDGLLNEFIRGGAKSGGGQGVGVNAYLWQATLDTLSFMPLTSADSFGGVVITDWYSPAEQADSRYKLNVYILGRELRADAIRVASFKQIRSGNDWQDVAANEVVDNELENTILTRARQMRIDAAALQE